jgi:hypothetical protein
MVEKVTYTHTPHTPSHALIHLSAAEGGGGGRNEPLFVHMKPPAKMTKIRRIKEWKQRTEPEDEF